MLLDPYRYATAGGSAISFVGMGTVRVRESNDTVDLDAGHSTGDLLVVVLSQSDDVAGLTGPSGWTTVNSTLVGGSGGDFGSCIAYKFATGSEGSTVSFQNGSSLRRLCVHR